MPPNSGPTHAGELMETVTRESLTEGVRDF